jgi:hypothetical protein
MIRILNLRYLVYSRTHALCEMKELTRLRVMVPWKPIVYP